MLKQKTWNLRICSCLEFRFKTPKNLLFISKGGIGVFGWAIGPIVSGKILSMVKITVQRSLALLILITFVSNIGFLLMMSVGCDDPQYGGLG